MDLLKKLQKKGTGFVLETDLEYFYEQNLIDKFRVQLYKVNEDGEESTAYKIVVKLTVIEEWLTLSSRRYKDKPREFKDYNTVIRHIQSRYPDTESVQLNLKPE